MQKAERVIARFDRMKGLRSTWENHWQEIAEYMIPRRADFQASWSPGARLNQNIYDGTAIWALEQFAAGLHGVLTPPERPWFSLEIRNAPDEAVGQDTRSWLDEVTKRIASGLNSPSSGFTSSVFDAWLDLGAFGTAVIYSEEGEEDNPLLFMHQPLRGCFLEEDREGRVDVVYRTNMMTARQVLHTWPKTASEQIKRKVEQSPEAKVDVIHAVEPDGKGAWQSIYLERDTKTILAEGRHNEMPYLVARWVRGGGETYARSPAMVALPDVRMINAMKKTVLRGAQKIVDPPLMVPDDDYITPIRTVPGALIMRRPGSEPIQPLHTGASVGLGMDLIGKTKDDILSAFNVELFRLADGPAKTATEVIYRREERLRLLGPVVGRLQRELLGPLIERCFAVLSRAGALPPPPEAVGGQELEVRYTSPLAQAQEAARSSGAEQLLAYVGQIAQMDPSVMDNVDLDASLRILAKARSVPASMLRGAEEVREMRQQRAEAQQQQQQAQQQAMMMQQMAQQQGEGQAPAGAT